MIAIMSDLVDAFLRMREREHSMGDGGVLFRTGDPVQWIWCVVEGSLHLVRNLPHGTTLTLQVASAGTVLAEASLFSEAYHCDAIAVGPARLFAVAGSSRLGGNFVVLPPSSTFLLRHSTGSLHHDD
jgi:CRP-like cAMP-binding protein